MPVINIRKAQREGARLVIGLAGISGSGKTLSALLLAYGLTNGDGEKVGFLDTENRRGSLYASNDTYDKIKSSLEMNEYPEPFYIGDLDAPFSPQRYIDAIHEFEKAGVEVLVIDSVSHEWEGTGGCEEIATLANPNKPQWNRAKAEHKRFMNALLQSNMHIIVCIRAREKVKLVKVNGKTEYEPQGIMPVTEKNVMFEMTASLMMWDSGKSQQVMKCPEELRDILGREDGYITAQDGLALRQWVQGGNQLDPKVEEYRNRLRNVTEKGQAYTQECWDKTPAKIRKALGDDFKQTLLESAIAYEKQRSSSNHDAQNVDELNSQVLGAGENQEG